MLSSSTRSAPAASARRTPSRSSASTSTGTPGRASRARATAAGRSTPPRARWLSFTRTMSCSPMRWFTPPPAATARFSSARHPGVVLRVSSTRAGRAASTNRAVMVAIPDRWDSPFSRVRSADSTAWAGPSTPSTLSPGDSTAPSAACQVPVRFIWRSTSSPNSRPASTPPERATTRPRARAPSGTVTCEVTSPAVPRSSARAAATSACRSIRGRACDRGPGAHPPPWRHRRSRRSPRRPRPGSPAPT